jgi:hypothetical protein
MEPDISSSQLMNVTQLVQMAIILTLVLILASPVPLDAWPARTQHLYFVRVVTIQQIIILWTGIQNAGLNNVEMEES